MRHRFSSPLVCVAAAALAQSPTPDAFNKALAGCSRALDRGEYASAARLAQATDGNATAPSRSRLRSGATGAQATDGNASAPSRSRLRSGPAGAQATDGNASAPYEQLRAAGPESARFQQMPGEQLSAAGDTEKAIAAFRRAVSADPKLSGPHLALSVVYVRMNKRDEALAEIDQELAIAPESAVARQVRQAINGVRP